MFCLRQSAPQFPVLQVRVKRVVSQLLLQLPVITDAVFLKGLVGLHEQGALLPVGVAAAEAGSACNSGEQASAADEQSDG